MQHVQTFFAYLKSIWHYVLPYISIGVLINWVILSYWAQLLPQFIGLIYLFIGGISHLNHRFFVQNYRKYDLISMNIIHFANVTPLIFLILWIGYIFEYFPETSCIISLVMFLSSTLGICYILIRERHIPLASIGHNTSLHVSWLTLSHHLLLVLINVIYLIS